MNYIEKIKEWFITSTLIDSKGKIYANFMPIKSVNYSIIENPVAQGGIVKNFVGGDRLIQYLVDFDTNLIHSNINDINNFDNSTYYQKLSDWIFKQNMIKELPKIKGIQSVQVTSSPFVKMVDSDNNNAIHSMTIRFDIYKEFDIFEHIQNKQNLKEKGELNDN